MLKCLTLKMKGRHMSFVNAQERIAKGSPFFTLQPKWGLHLSLALTILVSGYASNGYAETRTQTIYFAGVAYVGNVTDIQDRMPYTSAVVEEVGLVELNKRVLASIQTLERDDIKVTTELGRSTSGDAVAMALGLDFERLNPEYFPAVNQVCSSFTQVWAQILVFDLTDNKLLSAYPLKSSQNLKCLPDAQTLPTEVAKEWMKEALMGTEGSILAAFPQALETLPLNKGWRSNIQVRDIKLGKTVRARLETEGVDEGVYRRWLASTFSSQMSDSQSIPVLPYTLGQAVGGSMPLSFKNADAFQIELPPATFVVDLTARGYAKKTLDESKRTVRNAYIFALGISFNHRLLGINFMDQNLQTFEAITQNKSDSIDEWELFERVTISLSDEFFKQFPKPDSKWLKQKIKGKSSAKDRKKAFEAVEESVFKKMRGEG
jgi:hypothetical protein